MIFKNKIHVSETITLALPMIVGQLGQILMGVVDNAMVGQTGSVPLAASAVGNGLFMMILIIGMGLTTSIAPMIAEAHGAKNKSRIELILNQSLYIQIIAGILLSIIAYYAAFIIPFLGQEKDVEILATSYAKILSFSILPVLLFFMFKGVSDGLEHTKIAMVITLIANLVNAFANWLLIYGNWGFPELGLDGAGYATLSSRIFMFLALVIYVEKSAFFKDYHIHFRFIKWHKEICTKLISIGLASATQYFFEATAFISASFMIGWISAKSLAAHQIAINLASITYMVALGISFASSIRVANAKGRNDKIAVRAAGFTALELISALMGSFALIFVFFNAYLPTLYIQEVDVIKLASKLIIISAFFQLADGVQAVSLGNLRGISDIQIPTRLTFIAYWIIALPLAYLLGFTFGLGVQGIWYALSIGLFISGTLLSLRFNKLTK